MTYHPEEATQPATTGIVVLSYMHDICTARVCAPTGATDEELIAAVGPSGTSGGWSVERGNDNRGPITCASDPTRTHFLLVC